jgi:hypothetical protein
MSNQTLLVIPLVSALMLYHTGAALPALPSSLMVRPADGCVQPPPAERNAPPCQGTCQLKVVPPPAPVCSRENAPACASKGCELPRPICKGDGPALPEPCANSTPALPPIPEQPITHTMTINNGAKEVRQTFVQRDGEWRACREIQQYDVFYRDCPRSPWRFYGTYYSSRSAEEAACALRANGNLASVRRHCA